MYRDPRSRTLAARLAFALQRIPLPVSKSLRLPEKINVLLLGTGGREHALAWKMKQSPRLGQLWVEAGANAGILEIGKVCPEPTSGDVFRLGQWCDRESVNLVVIGPEGPLSEGLATKLAAPHRQVFGPSKEAARLEWDKAFAKQVMRHGSVPTADSKVFTDLEQARTFALTRTDGCVVKATGLCAGKGVIICNNATEALAAIDLFLVQKAFGDAGSTILIEEKLGGAEMSVIALTDGRSFTILDPAQDHKRVGDGDTGPNTGGMGAFSPTPNASKELLHLIYRDVFIPTIDAMKRLEIPFRGVLYAGIMLTPAGPKVLEFNTRFGDPETQPTMARLKSDILSLLWATTTGNLAEVDAEFDSRAACCTMVCSKGYPGAFVKGLPITGMGEARAIERGPREDIVLFHSGTCRGKGGEVLTNGGRVIGVTALAGTVARAAELSRAAAAKIKFEGAFYRTDIGVG